MLSDSHKKMFSTKQLLRVLLQEFGAVQTLKHPRLGRHCPSDIEQ
jgi:hypothetical protein